MNLIKFISMNTNNIGCTYIQTQAINPFIHINAILIKCSKHFRDFRGRLCEFDQKIHLHCIVAGSHSAFEHATRLTSYRGS